MFSNTLEGWVTILATNFGDEIFLINSLIFNYYLLLEQNLIVNPDQGCLSWIRYSRQKC